jgi:hypothetical protein
LTDSEEALASVAEAARDHEATAFWVGVLRLAPLVKEHYFGFIAEAYLELLRRYRRAYPGSDAPRKYRDRLDERIARVRERYGFGKDGGKTGEIGKSVVDLNPVIASPVPGQLAFAMPGM